MIVFVPTFLSLPALISSLNISTKLHPAKSHIASRLAFSARAMVKG